MTQKQMMKLEAEKERVAGMRAFERTLVCEKLGADHIQADRELLICGIDEAGRGPLAGPVAAAAVILPPDHDLLYINDSKKLSESKREKLFDEICSEAAAWAVGIVEPARIDEINILQATYEAMRQAVGSLTASPDLLLVDAVHIPDLTIRQVSIIKGDARSQSIAAASIIAKVTRDHLMEEYDRRFPEYAFASNKGYGTAAHIEALKKYGPTPIHRRSFIGHFVQEAN